MENGPHGWPRMKISIIIEGKTETAFFRVLRSFLEPRLPGIMPRLDPVPFDGGIPKREKLKRVVEGLLDGRFPADHVIALTDVYTGANPPEFTDAADAKTKMRTWVGEESRFHAHAAQHDFEAWLLPFWATIKMRAMTNRNGPTGRPESVNHGNPPAHRLKEIYELGQCKHSYVKPRDGLKILQENDLMVAINACLELKKFVNTILTLSGGTAIPWCRTFPILMCPLGPANPIPTTDALIMPNGSKLCFRESLSGSWFFLWQRSSPPASCRRRGLAWSRRRRRGRTGRAQRRPACSSRTAGPCIPQAARYRSAICPSPWRSRRTEGISWSAPPATRRAK